MTRRLKSDEDGSLLLILMVGVAVMSIGLGVAVQSWSKTWRRDSEEELVFRGQQYVDAILAYRKEHNGQFPTDLAELMKEGPRRVRYIRKLFPDPVNPGGKWGLLYLMPGGQGIYDPVAAQKQVNGDNGGPEADEVDDGAPRAAATGFPPGVTPISSLDPSGSGVGNPTGIPGAPGLPGGAGGLAGRQRGAAGSMMAPPPRMPTGSFDDDSPSEPPIGWPIVGVISRASGKRAEETFKIYRGHDRVDEWQFHVFDRGIQQTQAPPGVVPGGSPSPFVGPGYGGPGRGPMMGFGPGPQPGMGHTLPGGLKQKPGGSGQQQEQ